MSDEMLIARLNAPVELSDYVSISQLVITAKQASSRLFDYEKQIAKQQQEIIEYKAFMLGLKLSSEDEARMMYLLAKYKKAN